MVTTAVRDLAGIGVTNTGTATRGLAITATVPGLTTMASARRSSVSHSASVPGIGFTGGTGIGIKPSGGRSSWPPVLLSGSGTGRRELICVYWLAHMIRAIHTTSSVAIDRSS
jgi:hypothetical protein